MDSNNVFLNNLFNGLSSIYRQDNGMLNSNLFIVDNAYAEVFADIQRKINQVNNNTYIATADPSALEANFGTLVAFPKPPRLNTITGGDEIYRAMLKAMFRVFQSGATTASMDLALGTAVSYLTIDPNVSEVEKVTNYTHLYTTDKSIALTWPAVQASGNFVIGPARSGTAASGDIAFFPPDLIVTNYNASTQTISFTGTINTGTNYNIIYDVDATNNNGTNWVNLTNPSGLAVSPFDLQAAPISTYDNPQFSYWWNTFNADGHGIDIQQFSISGNDSSLIWRLPEKTIQFEAPYSQQTVTRTIDFYNNSGTAYDITNITPTNPDTLFDDAPLNYYTDVPSDFTKYYVRYSSNNNGPAQALSEFFGSFPLFTRYYVSISFNSANFGPLDFFEMNSGFDVNNLFGTGTTNIWLNVQNANGVYNLNNENLFLRQFSLHENILYSENFESGQLSTISSTNWTGTRISDSVGVPTFYKEDCLLLMGLQTGTSISISPILNAPTVFSGNHIEVDFFDAISSGTNSTIQISRTGTTGQYNSFVFGIDSNVQEFEFATQDPFSISKNYGFVETYFPNTTDTNRAIAFSQSYNLISGTNPNIIFSTNSFQPSGIAGGQGFVTPNANPTLINNTNDWLIQFNDSGSPNIAADIYSYRQIGIYQAPGPSGTFTPEPFYSYEIFGMQPNTGLGFWNYFTYTVTGFNPITAAVQYTTNASVTNIPYATGLNTLEVIKGSGIIVNGVSHPGYLGTAWTNLGFGSGPGIQYIQSNLPGTIEFRCDDQVTLEHYYLANSTTRDQFYNTITQYSGINTATVPYFYQIFNSSTQKEAQKNYLKNVPREYGWHTLTVDFSTAYTGTAATIDQFEFMNTSIPFTGKLLPTSGIALSTVTQYPLQEFSYYDNIQVSYYDPTQVLPQYQFIPLLQDDWEGSALSQSTIIDNKFFQNDPQPNFQFNVVIKGMDPDFIFIINNIINKLKPAHTIAVSIFEQDQMLDSTQQTAITSNTGTNWELGNVMNNIAIRPTPTVMVPPSFGYITISGTGV